MKILKNIIIAFVFMCLFVMMFGFAFLQESYKLNPPTEAERAEMPYLINFLIGE